MLSIARRRKLREAGIDLTERTIDDISDEKMKQIAEILELSETKAREIIEDALEPEELV